MSRWGAAWIMAQMEHDGAAEYIRVYRVPAFPHPIGECIRAGRSGHIGATHEGVIVRLTEATPTRSQLIKFLQ